MKLIDEIEDQFNGIDRYYYQKEFEASVRNYNRKVQHWQRQRELNTNAYFLFLITRLEDHLITESTKLILKKQATITHWKTRAVWDNLDAANITYKKRVSLLTQHNSSEYQKIVNYYNYRNQLAHGGFVQNIHQNINMIDVFNDMRYFMRVLKA